MTLNRPDTASGTDTLPIRKRLVTIALVLSLGALAAQATPQDENPPQDPAATAAAQEQTEAPPQTPPVGEDDIQKALEAAPKGRLAIQVVQGTQGADPIGEIDVHLVLLHRGSLVDSRDITTDDHGVAIVEDIMAAMSVLPQISVEYAGVTYQSMAKTPIGPQSLEGTLTLTVYDVTEQQPDWNVMMMHLFVDETEDGQIIVKQTAVVENPSDRTWLGDLSQAAPPATSDAQPGNQTDQAPNAPTARFTFPAAATDVELQDGFHGWCCTQRVEDTLVVRMPMMPGQSMYSFAYRLPTNEEKIDLTFGASAPIANAVVFLPDAGMDITPVGLNEDQPRQMGERVFRMYTGEKVAAGAQVGMTLSGFTGDSGAVAATRTLGSARTFVLIGAGILVLIALVGLVFRRTG